jgi:hypothetical protein
MPTLHELQTAMRTEVLALERAGHAGLEAVIFSDGVGATERLQIHRNHVFVSLGDTLASIFSAVEAIVGDAFFKAAAHHFISAQPPTEPTLYAYGADFAQFLADFEPAKGLPYLPDLARLEWALHESFHAPDQETLTHAALAEIPQDALFSQPMALHQSARLLYSDWPVDAVWYACQPGAETDLSTINLDGGGVQLFAVRQKGDVRLWSVSLGEWQWLLALAAGVGLGEASGIAVAADPSFDLATALGEHLDRGSFGPIAPSGQDDDNQTFE